MRTTTKLRGLLTEGEIVVAPGVFDDITARLVQQAGFPMACMTWAGTSLSLGFPGCGLLTMAEMTAKAAVIMRTADIPVVADANTGYGNGLNVTCTIQEYGRVGVAGVHIENQVAPKQCGHLQGKELVSEQEFVVKICAAIAARLDPDFIVIASTDVPAATGFEDAALAALRETRQPSAAGRGLSMSDRLPRMEAKKGHAIHTRFREPASLEKPA